METLDAELERALHLLDRLTEHKPPLSPLGALNPKLLASCRVCACAQPLLAPAGAGPDRPPVPRQSCSCTPRRRALQAPCLCRAAGDEGATWEKET